MQQDINTNLKDVYLDEEVEAEEPNEPVKEEPVEDPVEKKEESAIKTVVRKKQNVTVVYPVDSPNKLTDGDEVVLPSNYDEETKELLEDMPNVELLDSVESRKWANDIAEGLDLNTYGETYVGSLERPDADFQHHVEDSGKSLMAQSPKFKNTENQNLKGERAVIRIMSHLGLGSLFQVPLWHSGIWLTIKPPSESEIIELNRQIISDKIKFGRYTYGLSFSNISSYTTDRLVDFALAHVYDLTVKPEDVSIGNLKDHISCQDIPILIWGLVCSMYPRGFRYRRACVNNPDKCNYVAEDTLDVSKLQWTDVSAITDWQKSYMASRQSKCKTLEEVNRYKDELSNIRSTKIVINEGLSNEISMVIKTPTVKEHVDSGFRWISDIVSSVDETMGVEKDEEKRNSYIIRHGQATSMRQYVHWIQSIDCDSNTVDDKDTIEKTLDFLSSDDYIRNEFINKIVEYINDSTISIIGIPTFECPACGTSQSETTDGNFTNILPLDVMQLFFALLTQRLNRLMTR